MAEDLGVPLLDSLHIVSEPPGLRRSLRRWDGILMTVGTIVGESPYIIYRLFSSGSVNKNASAPGSGVFTSPGVVMRDAGSVWAGLAAWLIAAVMAALSALCYAELSTAVPTAVRPAPCRMWTEVQHAWMYLVLPSLQRSIQFYQSCGFRGVTLITSAKPLVTDFHSFGRGPLSGRAPPPACSFVIVHRRSPVLLLN